MGSSRLGWGTAGWDGVQQVEMGSSRLGVVQQVGMGSSRLGWGPAGWDGFGRLGWGPAG